MGFSTSNALCPVSGHRAKTIRKAEPEARPRLVANLLADKYPKYATLDEQTRQLIHQEVLQAIQEASGNYRISPRGLGMSGVLEIAKHAIPVGLAAGASGCTAMYLGKPIVQEALQGQFGKAGVRVAIGVALFYSAYRIVKDLFQSGAMHAPLAQEINQAAVYSIDQHARDDLIGAP